MKIPFLNLKISSRSLKNPDGSYNGALITTVVAGILVVLLNICNMLNLKFPVDIRSLVEVINSIASVLALLGIMSYGHISDDNGIPTPDVPVQVEKPIKSESASELKTTSASATTTSASESVSNSSIVAPTVKDSLSK